MTVGKFLDSRLYVGFRPDSTVDLTQAGTFGLTDRTIALFNEGKEPWAKDRLVLVEDRIRKRLAELASHLGEAEWLDGEFSAADLLMVTVLRRLTGAGLLEQQPNLMAYIARAEARPAYQRAFQAQLAVFNASVQ